jgi:hypothetical protein
VKAKEETIGTQIAAIVSAMREGGVGKLRLGEIEIDLTCAPIPLPEPAVLLDEDEKRRLQQAEIERTLFRNRRVSLPYHGAPRRTGDGG